MYCKPTSIKSVLYMDYQSINQNTLIVDTTPNVSSWSEANGAAECSHWMSDSSVIIYDSEFRSGLQERWRWSHCQQYFVKYLIIMKAVVMLIIICCKCKTAESVQAEGPRLWGRKQHQTYQCNPIIYSLTSITLMTRAESANNDRI